jgi:putative ABC transport system ATP-binding protein
MADEPTGNLDSKSGEEVMQLLLQMNKDLGTTLIIITHDGDIANVCRRVIHIRDGVTTEVKQ